METMIYLDEVVYNDLKKITALIDKHGSVPGRKDIARELNMGMSSVNVMMARLSNAKVLVRIDPGTWQLMVRPEDFKDNLREMMGNESCKGSE